MPPRQVPRKSVDGPIECKNLEPENRFGQASRILGAGIDPVSRSKTRTLANCARMRHPSITASALSRDTYPSDRRLRFVRPLFFLLLPEIFSLARPRLAS